MTIKQHDEELEQLKSKLNDYRTAISDAKYIMGQYKTPYPEEAWQTLWKLINDPKLR